eukprot:CAMPEP_0184743320 /NCGR_PEP_ID=MMETSP0315-20130426/6203_1 /TAXON_ID=101924 /ORGANISM="Rhodosorus marinus, Strain UTEX LB 2760" /LENGTH=43 /DNA_ID= /DNA_START= /DNA_END= /DNA_ORIENTATION=
MTTDSHSSPGLAMQSESPTSDGTGDIDGYISDPRASANGLPSG